MSSQAPSWRLAAAPIRVSFGTGCNPGSIHTLWQTSVSKVAVRLRISLCLIEGNPAQDKACSTENLLPQVQIDGISDGVQPYLRAKALWKTPLWRAKPCSTRGKAVDQVNDPFSFNSSPQRDRQDLKDRIRKYAKVSIATS